MALTGDRSKGWLRSKVDKLSAEVTLILGNALVQTTRKARI